jgi:hypothetical protein
MIDRLLQATRYRLGQGSNEPSTCDWLNLYTEPFPLRGAGVQGNEATAGDHKERARRQQYITVAPLPRRGSGEHRNEKSRRSDTFF